MGQKSVFKFELKQNKTKTCLNKIQTNKTRPQTELNVKTHLHLVASNFKFKFDLKFRQQLNLRQRKINMKMEKKER